MAVHATIRYLQRSEIDPSKWNAAVERDPGRFPYGFVWWLDIVTNKKWNALVLDDYRAVLPLPYRHSIGPFLTIHRPAFTQQGGPWGDWHSEDIGPLLQHIPKGAISVALPLRHETDMEQVPEQYTVNQRTNLEVDLDRDWTEIQGGFSKTLRKSLRKFSGGTLCESTAETVIEVYRESVGEKAGLNQGHYRMITHLVAAAKQGGCGQTWQFVDEKGILLAAGFFPEYRGRMINLFCGSTEAGYRDKGMSRILAALMELHHGPGRLFDFEGSDLPGVAEYFKKFGPERRPYPFLSRSIW